MSDDEEESGSPEEESTGEEDTGTPGDDAEDLKSTYQLIMMITCYLTYCLFLYNRNAFLYSLPHVLSEGRISNFHITIVVLLQGISLAVSTWVSGVLMDKLKVKFWCPVSLFFSGFFILGLSDTEDPQFMSILALMNGVAQGFSHICVFTILKNWYDPRSFGILYGVLNTSSNFIGLAGAHYATMWCSEHGWRTALQMPAVITMLMAPTAYYILVDRPSTLSLEDPFWLPKPGEDEPVDWTDIFTSNLTLLFMPVYFSASLVFAGTKDWGQMFLMEEMYLSGETTQGYSSSYEIGSAVGSMFFGSVTDLLIKKKFWLLGYRKIRLFWVFVSLGGALFMLNVLFLSFDSSATYGMVNMVAGIMGFFMNGALTLIGILICEHAPPQNTPSTIGILHSAQMWALMVGAVPLSSLALSYDWGTAFMVLNLTLVLSLFSLVMGRDLNLRFTPEPAKLE